MASAGPPGWDPNLLRQRIAELEADNRKMRDQLTRDGAEPTPAVDGLRIYRARDYMGIIYWGVETGPECNNCGGELDAAHAVFETVAMLMGERLRQAFSAHLDEHGCGRHGGPGFAYCDEAVRLFELMPEGDKVLIG